MKVAADSDDEARLWKAQINQAIREASSIHAVTVGGQVYEIDRRYVPKRRIGSGAYGTVISAVDEQSGNQVAIKKVKDAFDDLIDAKRILREVRLMRAFSHPNILGLYDLIRPSSLEHFEDVYIISEKKSSDMQRIIFSDTPLSEDQQQWIMYQCLCGIKYMHSAGVLHRDLKPSNLLVDTETCDVQICDFGLSRSVGFLFLLICFCVYCELIYPFYILFSNWYNRGDITEEEGEKKEQTEYVVTRWYRAPEIMLGYSTYDYAIDVWSLGCIFGEILGREALLPGGDYIEQLKLIVNLVGSPTEGDLWYVSNRNARDFMMRLPKTNGQDFKVKFPSASDDAIDLLGKMLTMDPAKRLRVDEAITHQYQLPVREAERLEFNAREHTEVSDIESMELTKENLQRMLFEEIRLFHEERGAVQQVPSGLAQPSGMSLSER